MNNFFRLSIIVLLFASCENTGDADLMDPAPPAPTAVAPPPAPAPDTSKPVTISTTPALPTITTTPALPTIKPAENAATSTVAKNPAHGSPGHRCDIPVGAPLNTPAASAAAPAATSTPVPPATTAPAPIAPLAPVAPPTNNKVRLNPAHGQPGHDCKVPVGQPLKS